MVQLLVRVGRKYNKHLQEQREKDNVMRYKKVASSSIPPRETYAHPVVEWN